MKLDVDSTIGQLWKPERKLLYESVTRLKPSVCVEIGTWKGAGSTFMIASALEECGSGVLHTIEQDESLYNEAVARYRSQWVNLLPRVVFHHGKSMDILPGLLPELGSVGLVFMDGANSPAGALETFLALEPFIIFGGSFLMHDWNREISSRVRSYIETSPSWKIDVQLGIPGSDTDESGLFEHGSVGMVKAIKSK